MGTQKRESLCPAVVADPIGKKKVSSCKHSAIEKSWTPAVLTVALWTSFSSLCQGKCSPSLPMQGLWFGSLWFWTQNCNSLLSWINPSLLYLAVYLFQVCIIQVTHTSETSYLIGVHPTKSWRNVETGIVLKLARISHGFRLLAE